MMEAYCRPTMPPPNSLTLSPMPISLTERMIAAGIRRIRRDEHHIGFLAARMARMTEENSTVLGG